MDRLLVAVAAPSERYCPALNTYVGYPDMFRPIAAIVSGHRLKTGALIGAVAKTVKASNATVTWRTSAPGNDETRSSKTAGEVRASCPAKTSRSASGPLVLVEGRRHRHDGVRLYRSDRIDGRGLPQGAADSRRGPSTPPAPSSSPSEDVAAGQQVFLKYGLMANGTIWGHGAYLGPDFSAQYLHNWALDVADQAAQARFRRPYAELTPGSSAARSTAASRGR